MIFNHFDQILLECHFLRSYIIICNDRHNPRNIGSGVIGKGQNTIHGTVKPKRLNNLKTASTDFNQIFVKFLSHYAKLPVN